MATMPANTSKPSTLSFDAGDWLVTSSYRHIEIQDIVGGNIYSPDSRIKNELWRLGSIDVKHRVFNCCGITQLENMTGSFNGEEHKQEWLVALCRSIQYSGFESFTLAKGPDVMWCVTDKSDVGGRYFNSNSSHGLLVELGAKKIDSFPNRVHAPAILNVYRWHTADNLEALKKYIYFNTKHSFIPLYAKEAWDEHQQQRNRPLSAPVATTTQDPFEQRPVGADPIGGVRPALGAGNGQLDANQGIQQQANQAAIGGDAGWNATLPGVSGFAG